MVLPSNRKDKYDNVKKYLCVDCPVPSQCVVARTLSRPQALMTVATKIALQMACKMGGELWSVEIPVCCAHVIQNMHKFVTLCYISGRGYGPHLSKERMPYDKCIFPHTDQHISLDVTVGYDQI